MTMVEQFDLFSEQVSRDHLTMSHAPKTSKTKPPVVPVSEADVESPS